MLHSGKPKLAKKAQTQTGSKAIRAVWSDARQAAEDKIWVQEPNPNLPRNGIKPGQWPGFPHDNMPPDCPIQVVGRDAEGNVYCISTTGHLRKIERWDVAVITDLFAPRTNYAKWAWPGWTKPKKVSEDEIIPPSVDRIERDKCMMAIIEEAARQDTFNPQSQYRGTGGWQDRQKRFVWHSGDYLWINDGKRLERARPARHEGYLYARQELTIEPWQEPVSQVESPARRILADLGTWNWERPYLDPLLVLGWIATALMGGALAARPIIFTTGGAGVGKSRLHELVKLVLEGVVITSVNTTAAGIYQRVKLDSRPVMVDELENKAGSNRAESVIELARVAYSGGEISRGGQDHEATTFTVRNSFFFSAIIPPHMGTQDKTRMAVLNLNALERAGKYGRDIDVSPETDGRMILRQVMDGWSDFSQRLLPHYAKILGRHGLSARAIDTYGTLLAAAELLVGPEVLEEIGLPVTEEDHLGEMIAAATSAERTENLTHWHKCIDILFQSTIDKWTSGEKPTIGGVLEDVAADDINRLSLVEGQKRLQLMNVSCIYKKDLSPSLILAVPADGPMLNRIFGDTDFQKGGWFAALKQAPPAIVLRGNKPNDLKVKINASAKHCMLIDLAAFQAYAERL